MKKWFKRNILFYKKVKPEDYLWEADMALSLRIWRFEYWVDLHGDNHEIRWKKIFNHT